VHSLERWRTVLGTCDYLCSDWREELDFAFWEKATECLPDHSKVITVVDIGDLVTATADFLTDTA
jgi:hypothetical protein